MPAREVVYYPPFGHYLAADLFRAAIVAAAVIAVAWLLANAVRGWADRRRTSLFLAGLACSLAVHASTSSVGLGHPPVWPLLAARAVVIVFGLATCRLVSKDRKATG